MSMFTGANNVYISNSTFNIITTQTDDQTLDTVSQYYHHYLLSIAHLGFLLDI